MACSAVHSAWVVGLLSAKIIGRLQFKAICLQTVSVKALPKPATPKKFHSLQNIFYDELYNVMIEDAYLLGQ